MKNYLSEEFFDLTKQLFRKMRTTCLLILVFASSLFASNVNSQVAKVSLSIKNSNLINVLDAIERQTDYLFVYNKSEIDLNREINMEVKDQSVSAVLSGIFQSTGISYAMEGNNIVLFNKMDKLQQQKSVTGKVIDSTGGGLPGVSVVIKGTTTGTITDFDGNYSLANVPVNAILQFSFVGMKSQEIAVGSKTTIDVTLADETVGIEEVVAIGYGVQKKSLVTGAISSVSAADFENASISRAEQALQGKTAGVQVISSSGAPGASTNVRIRGVSTNGSSEPLYIVDGVRTRDINFLAPGDIEKMEVLKDAASSAIYGAEGGNGVVLITTKGGKAGKSELSYDVQFGVSNASNLPKVLNSSDYLQYYSEAGEKGIVSTGEDTDWLSSVFENGFSQRHHLSYSGGTEKSTYMVAGSFDKQDGIVTGSKDEFKRYSFRFNGDHNLKSWLKLGNNISYSHIDRSAIVEDSEFGGVLSGALMLDPTTPLYYTDNSKIPSKVQNIINAHPEVVRNSNGNIYGISPYVTGEIVNPLVLIANQMGTTQSDKIVGSMYVEVSPFKNLKITSRGGLDLSYQLYHGWNPPYYYTTERSNSLATVVETMDKFYNWQWENFATYANKIDDHSLNVVVGTAAQSFTHRYTHLTGGPMNVATDTYSDFDYISSQKNSFVTGHILESRLLSYFGRVSYDYKGKYMAQGSLRRDGASTSTLPKKGRWGVFPSFSLGWLLSSEEFYNLPAINYLKLRGSWGQNGSLSNLSNYQYYGFLTSTGLNYEIDNKTMAVPIEKSNLDNLDLTWETSVQSDFGIDLRAWKDRINFSVDYYNKKTTDLLTPNTPPFEAGNTSAFINAGDVVNRGFEFDFGIKNKGSKLNYQINLNLATLHNEVTYLNPTISRISGSAANGNGWTATYVEKGYPIWYFRGFKTNGIDPKTGDPIIVDVSGDGSISTDDYTYIGDPHPDFTFGGNIKLDYKGFDLAVFAQGSKGNDILLSFMRNDRIGINRLQTFYDNRWTPTNTNASMPKAGTNARNWNSDLVVFDGSYVRIKQIQLGYTLPQTMVKSIGLGRVRAYVSFDDFFTFTKYPGLDPEAGSTSNSSIGVDRGVYPVSRRVVFGASISF